MKFVESKVMIVENLINCRNLYNFVQKQTKKGVRGKNENFEFTCFTLKSNA